MTAIAQVAQASASDIQAALDITIERKSYPAAAGRAELTVLRDVKIAVAPRSFVVLTGPSGCGKSTLLNIVAGLDQDYSGTIGFAAADPRVAFIFQTPRLLPWCTVEQNIALALPDGDPRNAHIADMLARVGLAGAETAYPERLSLGMQRRVALARGFITEPDILLMDEPFVSLDDPTAAGLRGLVAELWQRCRATVVFVTHDRAEAVKLGTRIVQLRALSGPGQTSVVSDVAVELSPLQRGDAAALAAEQARVFGAS